MGQLVEWLFERLYRVERLAPDDDMVLFRIAPQVRKGPEIILGDGTRIAPGDRVAELHMRNDVLADLHSKHDDPRRVGLAYLRAARHTLAVLADRWRTDPRFDGIAAVYGTTLFPEHAHGVGFEVRELLPAWRRRLLSWHIRRIVIGAHPRGRERVMLDGRPREVREVWLSRDACTRLYGEARTPVTQPAQPSEKADD